MQTTSLIPTVQLENKGRLHTHYLSKCPQGPGLKWAEIPYYMFVSLAAVSTYPLLLRTLQVNGVSVSVLGLKEAVTLVEDHITTYTHLIY